jgi:hypothetical protein
VSTESLRRRIDRLAQRRRRTARRWMEPLGLRDGIPWQAIWYEHENGQRWALEVPVPAKTTAEWRAWVESHPWPPLRPGR